MIDHIDLKPSNILLELEDPEAVISSYLQQTSVRTSQPGQTRLKDIDTDSETIEIPIPLSEVITTPLLSKTEDVRVKIIDFGVCRLSLSCSVLPKSLNFTHSVLGEPASI